MTYIDHIVQGAMLCHRDQGRLMVSSRVDASYTVRASGKTFSQGDRQFTVNSCIIDTFEVCKFGRIRGSCVLQGCNGFDDEMRMPDDLALRIQLLGCRKVVGVGIHKIASLEIADGHHDVKRRVGFQRAEIR